MQFLQLVLLLICGTAVTALTCEKDGKYPSSHRQCSAYFWFCKAATRYKVLCPKGLFFNKRTNQCDRKSEVFECNGVVRKEVIEENNKVITFDCSGKSDGFYELSDCSDMVIECVQGLSFFQKCPSNLVFNKYTKRCGLASECQVYRATHPGSDHHVQHHAEFDCSHKDDGLYEIGKCKPMFILCSAGAAYDEHCTSGLVFSQKIKSCEKLESCLSSHKNQVQSNPKNKEKAPCHNRYDGNYGLRKCSPYYFVCSDDEVSYMRCPYNLFFDRNSGQCDFKENVIACNEEVRTLEKPFTHHIRPTPSTSNESHSHLHHHNKESKCKGKANGYYSNGCSSRYYVCFNGIATALQCPSHLKYNERKKRCDYTENVTKCQGNNSTTSLSSLDRLDEFKESSDQSNGKTKVDFKCEHKADGFYSHGCSSLYYACSNGIVSQFECAKNLKYDQNNMRCDFEKNVHDCILRKVHKTELEKHARVERDSSHYLQEHHEIKHKAFSCGLDGFYAYGCSSTYYSCSKGVAMALECPGTLKFNENSLRCDSADVITKCQETFRYDHKEIPQKPSDERHNNSHGRNQNQNQTRERKGHSFCSGKKDGFYSNGCSPNYYICLQGAVRSFECPGSLKYDKNSRECSQPDRIQECRRRHSLLNDHRSLRERINPNLIALDEVAEKQTEEVKVEISPILDQRPVQGFCYRKADGVYAYGCSGKYAICSESKEYLYTCPIGEAFNERKSMCDKPINMKQCRFH